MAEAVEIDIIANDKTSGIIQGIFQGIGQTLANLALQIPGMIADFGKDIIQQANEAELALADLEATIASTGGVAGITADEALKLAESLSEVTRFSDDSILAGENMLLTFTNIGEDIFPQATEALLDMATKMGSDLPNAAIQLGKALQDPIQGVTALRRVGVALTEQQEEQIKGFMAVGDIASAQKIILEELNKEFGGQAAAAADTFAGQMDILRNRIDNVKESIGMALIPILTDLMDKVVIPLLPLIEKMATDFEKFISGFAESSASIQPFIDGLTDKLFPILQNLSNWWAVNGGAIILRAKEIGAAIVDFVSMVWEDYLQPFIEEQLPKLSAWWEENSPNIAAALENVKQAFLDALPGILEFFEALSPLLIGFQDLFLEWWEMIFQILAGDWPAAWESAKEIVSIVADSIGQTIENLAGIIVESLGFQKTDIVEIWSENWDQLLQIVNTISDLIEGRVDGLVQSVKSAMGEIAGSALTGVVGDELGGIVAGAITGGYGGGQSRDRGGSGIAGQTYMIGTGAQPEAFVPDTNGTFIPNGGLGGISVTLNYSPTVSLGNRQEAEQTLLPYILEGIRKAQQNGLVSVA